MRSYGQFCGVARALDVIGDRWSLLIMRELLLRPSRYSELRAAMPGVATNLLAQRLRELESAGLVARTDGGYAATERGEALRPVLRELVRFAFPYMVEGQGGDSACGQWLAGATDALFSGADLRAVHGLRIAARAEDEDVLLEVRDDHLEARVGVTGDADVRVSGSLEGVIAALSGMPTDAPARVEGDVDGLAALRARVLTPA